MQFIPDPEEALMYTRECEHSGDIVVVLIECGTEKLDFVQV